MELSGLVSITAADAAAHGLPPIAIHFDSTKTGFFGAAFPEAGMFLRMGGPPGGPCRLEIEWRPAGREGKLPDPAALARRHDIPRNKFKAGAAGMIECAGAARAAVSWRIQPTPWVEQLSGILIPVPKHGGAIWVVLPGEGNLDSPPRAAQHYEKVIKTLEVRP